jgi:hypothetical protein
VLCALRLANGSAIVLTARRLVRCEILELRTACLATRSSFRYVTDTGGIGMPRSSEDEPDKVRLMKAATDLINALKKAKIPGEPLKFRRPHLEATDTAGWSVTIATMESGLPALEVFLDRWVGGDERRFWFGFFARKPTPISKVIEVCPSRSSRQIEDADIAKAKGGYWALKSPLRKLEANKPVPEQFFNDDMFYFGLYDLIKKAPDIKRAVAFFVPIIRRLRTGNPGQIEPRQYGFFKRLNRDRQQNFRKAVLLAYDGACAVTRCTVEECLEATHLDRFADSCDNRVINGILLRADLHRLMDAGLMIFSWSQEEVTARIHPSVKEKTYRDLDDTPIDLPDARPCRPSKECIERHASGSAFQNS